MTCLRCGEITNDRYCKFTAGCTSERNLKLGQYSDEMMKSCPLHFMGHLVDYRLKLQMADLVTYMECC